MKGRKNKPEDMKKLEGTKNPTRENKKKPEADPNLPKPPQWLSESGKKAYRDLAKDLERMGVASKEDTHMLSIVCQAYGQLVELAEWLNKNGMVYETTTDRGATARKKNPEAELAIMKEKFVTSKLTEFGLSPSSREKVSKVANSEESESGLSKLMNGES